MLYNPFSLEGKTILITGASSGIGKATAIECAKLGANLIITGRNAKRLQETFELLEGENHMQILGDLTIEHDMENLLAMIPKIDGCIFKFLFVSLHSISIKGMDQDRIDVGRDPVINVPSPFLLHLKTG